MFQNPHRNLCSVILHCFIWNSGHIIQTYLLSFVPSDQVWPTWIQRSEPGGPNSQCFFFFSNNPFWHFSLTRNVQEFTETGGGLGSGTWATRGPFPATPQTFGLLSQAYLRTRVMQTRLWVACSASIQRNHHYLPTACILAHDIRPAHLPDSGNFISLESSTSEEAEVPQSTQTGIVLVQKKWQFLRLFTIWAIRCCPDLIWHVCFVQVCNRFDRHTSVWTDKSLYCGSDCQVYSELNCHCTSACQTWQGKAPTCAINASLSTQAQLQIFFSCRRLSTLWTWNELIRLRWVDSPDPQMKHLCWYWWQPKAIYPPGISRKTTKINEIQLNQMNRKKVSLCAVCCWFDVLFRKCSLVCWRGASLKLPRPQSDADTQHPISKASV